MVTVRSDTEVFFTLGASIPSSFGEAKEKLRQVVVALEI